MGTFPHPREGYARWDELRQIVAPERLPAALVDLDALDRNIDRMTARIAPSGKTIRVASKSIRHRGILARVLARGGARVRGVLCFTADEAAWLAASGIDDLLVAYPTTQRRALDELAAAVARGATIRCVADDRDHLESLSAAALRARTTLELVIDLDVSYRPARDRLHVGVRRSPLRTPADVAAIARAARAMPGIRIVGLMAYEAHVAGLPDRSVSSGAARNAAIRALKRVAMPAVITLRGAAVDALRGEGIEPILVDGGGTGSIEATSHDPAVTEVAVGSGFLCSHLFDGYDGLELEPAQLFALEVVRIPDRDHVTCAGGGYVASGAPGVDRLPIPVEPPGLSLLALEGAGEVQTPLRVAGAPRRPRIGDPIFFRHAKAGELAERFPEYLLLRGREIVGREPTYRGEGRCFL
jgi:D-serine deaminase-like pyridoxal phosphate-dependent protein